MPSSPTQLRQVIEEGLRQKSHLPLEDLVREMRTKGDSWKSVSETIAERSGWTATHQTLINWFPEYNLPAAELAETKT